VEVFLWSSGRSDSPPSVTTSRPPLPLDPTTLGWPPIYRRGVAGGRASKDTDTPVVKKNVALLTSCFDIVRPTTPKMPRLGDNESPAPPLTSIRSRAKPTAVLSSSCSREYDWLIEPVNHAETFLTAHVAEWYSAVGGEVWDRGECDEPSADGAPPGWYG